MVDLQPQLERATRGDRRALRQVVDAWIPQIRRWALIATGDPVLAEDGVQEAMVRLLRGIHRYDPRRPFAPWLKAVVFNACRNELARQGRHSGSHDPGADPASADPPPGHQLDLKRATAKAIDAFALLSPRQRQIVDLVDLRGHTPTEVADLLGLTPGAVRGQLYAARRALRGHLVHADEILPLLREA